MIGCVELVVCLDDCLAQMCRYVVVVLWEDAREMDQPSILELGYGLIFGPCENIMTGFHDRRGHYLVTASFYILVIQSARDLPLMNPFSLLPFFWQYVSKTWLP